MVSDEQLRFRRAAIAAILCASLNLLALLGLILFLRPGLPPSPDRLRFLIDHVPQWSSAWCLWMITGILLVTFYTCLRDATAGPRLAVWIAAAGLVPDLAAEVFYMMRYPNVLDASLLPPLDRWMALLSGGIGNGAYTLAWHLLARRAPLPRASLLLSIPGIAAGYALAVSGFANWTPGLVIGTAVAIPCFTLWAFFVGLFYWKKARAIATMTAHA